MSFRRKDRELLAEVLHETREFREWFGEKLERIDTTVITRYPDSGRAADEFAALRKAYLGGARSENLHAKNLIVLVQRIDEGATTGTIREKTVEFLDLFGVREITPAQVGELDSQLQPLFFREVGDSASESSAWYRVDESGTTVIEKGRVSQFPTPANAHESASPLEDASTGVAESEGDGTSTSASELQHSVEPESNDAAVEQSPLTQGEGESK